VLRYQPHLLPAVGLEVDVEGKLLMHGDELDACPSFRRAITIVIDPLRVSQPPNLRYKEGWEQPSYASRVIRWSVENLSVVPLSLWC
jgi:hypothetical protein